MNASSQTVELVQNYENTSPHILCYFAGKITDVGSNEQGQGCTFDRHGWTDVQ